MEAPLADRTGRRLNLAGAGLGLLLPAGFAALIYTGDPRPDRGLDQLSFLLIWATPAVMALLSLPSRPFLLVPATVLGFLSAYTPFFLISVAFLVPTVLYWAAYSRRGPQPVGAGRAVGAVLLPVLAAVGALGVLFMQQDPRCWTWVEDASGDRAYTVLPDPECSLDPRGGIEPVLVEPGADPEAVRSGRGAASNTVSVPEAMASAGLLAAGLTGARTLVPAALPPAPIVRPWGRDGS